MFHDIPDLPSINLANCPSNLFPFFAIISANLAMDGLEKSQFRRPLAGPLELPYYSLNSLMANSISSRIPTTLSAYPRSFQVLFPTYVLLFFKVVQNLCNSQIPPVQHHCSTHSFVLVRNRHRSRTCLTGVTGKGFGSQSFVRRPHFSLGTVSMHC